MAIPSSGAVSFTTIQTEFGGSNPIGLNEYYAGGGLTPAGTSGTNGPVPTSGAISVANFYGTTAATVPGAPTIGTATATGVTTATVGYTAPASNGGSTILCYRAYDNSGNYRGVIYQAGSGTISITGLTGSTSYSFRVYANNSVGQGSPSGFSNTITTAAPPAPPGQVAFTTPGTYTWYPPAGVTSVSVVAVGAGGGGGRGGGAGGGLGWRNNITVSSSTGYSVRVGVNNCRGVGGGESSWFNYTVSGSDVVGGGANEVGCCCCGFWSAPGSFSGAGGGSGGRGAYYPPVGAYNQGGGGGAGGYAGAGGNGAFTSPGGSGSGGGGGGGRLGCNSSGISGGGGGVGILGQGSSGAGAPSQASNGGGGGSGGANGVTVSSGGTAGGNGGAYGGGGGKHYYGCRQTAGFGGQGAVRIIWPGTTRQFPSTGTGNV